MVSHILRRLVATLPTLLLLILVVVLFAEFVDTSVVDSLIQEQALSPEARQRLEEDLGLASEFPGTYFDYSLGLFQADLGTSYISRRPVTEMITERMDVTIELAIYSMIIGWSVGIAIGVISATRQDGVVDYALRTFAILGLTIPTFAIGTAALIFPAIWWEWSPPLFYTSLVEDPWSHFKQMMLPSVIIAFALMGPVMRLSRTQMLEVVRQDYIRTARVKGLSEPVVVRRHALRNALMPVISLFGLHVATALTGSVIMEQLFALPGLGSLLITSVTSGDWPVVQGITAVVGIWVIMVNLLVDVSYGFIDPRVRRA